MTFQDWILQVRAEHGGTDRNLAKRLGMKDSTVHAWLTGRNNVSARSCALLALLTGVPAQDIADMADVEFDEAKYADVKLPGNGRNYRRFVIGAIYPNCIGCGVHNLENAKYTQRRQRCLELALDGHPVLCENVEEIEAGRLDLWGINDE